MWHWVCEEVGQWDNDQLRQLENERQWSSEAVGTMVQCGSGAVKLWIEILRGSGTMWHRVSEAVGQWDNESMINLAVGIVR